jgi:hypothetical protein
MLEYCLLGGLHQKLVYKRYFSWRKVLETPYLWACSVSASFTFYYKFLNFVDNECYDEDTCGSKRLYKLKSIQNHPTETLRNLYNLKLSVSEDESLMLWKVYSPSKPDRFGTNSV